MKIVYAPRWMLHALAAASQPKEALLNLPVLVNTLSVEDVAIYLATNKKLSEFLPEALVGSCSGPEFDFTKAPELALNDALFNVKLNGKDIPAESKDKGLRLTCDLIGPDTILVHYIDDNEPNVDADQKTYALYERFLRQLYTVLTFPQLAVLPVMGAYLSLRRTMLTPNRIV